MNVTDLMEQRDAQWSAALAGGRQKITALRKVYADAGWKMCPHPTCPPFDCRAEKVPCEFLDGLTCPCGNATHTDGFDTCTPEGVECEPDAEWTGTVRCASCGRLYDTTTFDGSTVTVVRGPDLHCRWCGQGARLVVHPEHGKMARCEQPVSRCPSDQADEGHHSIIGVVPSACVNPTHDHDEITDPDGGSEPVTNLCNDDGVPMHYDTTKEWYFHNRLDVDGCFLAGPNPENPCYTHGELADDKARCQGEPWPERHSDTCLWCRHATLTESRRKHDA